MNTNTPHHISEFIFRRLTDPVKLFGFELPPELWYVILAVVLLVGFFYIGWMYYRDSKGVGPWWASFLGIFRAAVYVILAIVFLLPAKQSYDETTSKSSIALLFDTSLSMETQDDMPGEGQSFQDVPTRQDKVLSFLTNDKIDFLGNLEKKNPLTVYRFGKKLDERSFWYLANGKNWTAEEFEAERKKAQDAQQTDKPEEKFTGLTLMWWLLPLLFLLPALALVIWTSAQVANRAGAGWAAILAVAQLLVCLGLVGGYYFYLYRSLDQQALEAAEKADTPINNAQARKPLQRELLATWFKPAAPKKDAPLEWDQADKDRLARLQKLNEDSLDDIKGTNVGDSVLATLNREINNMLQGIVVFTDGRSTLGSSLAFQELEQRAKTARVPIFVVAVGAERPTIRTEIVDVRAPKQIQPEDKFRVVGEVTGEGQVEQPIDMILDVSHIKKLPKAKEDKEAKEQALELVIVEGDTNPQDREKNKDKKRIQISLGLKVPLKPAEQPRFDRGNPPRAEVEFPIDAVTLAKAAGVDLTSYTVVSDAARRAGITLSENDFRSRKWKWELGEAKDDEFIRFVARVPRHKGEIFPDPEHLSQKIDMQVIKKPLRILFFAGGPTREYQFLRTLMAREVKKGHVELSIFLQLPPGLTEAEVLKRRTGTVQDIDPKRMLSKFPDKLDAQIEDKDEKLYDLAEYDVMICFDPDWTQLDDKQLKSIEKWVDQGSGLIAIGGGINTLQLARPGAQKDKLKPILDLYPVILKDVRIEDLDRNTDKPWPLSFEGASPEMEFLKLAEDTAAGPVPFLSDWQEFFYGGNKERSQVENGIFNYYPVEHAKAGALVVARFTDPLARLKDGSLQPYLVISDPASGRRVVWLGSGEMWNLRRHSEAFHERFWTKLARYAASQSQGKTNKRITPIIGRNFKANKPFDIEAKIDGKGGEPLGKNAKPPLITLEVPAGAAEETPKEMKPKPQSQGWFSAKLQLRTAGDYKWKLKVPETNDTAEGSFHVDEPNPELDNTRPDFDQLYHLASEADDVLARVEEADRLTLIKRLSRAKLSTAKEEGKEEGQEEKLRLYFNLSNADLIPRCMVTDVKTQRNRGAVEDQWDQGFTIVKAEPPKQPIKLSYVLLLVVGLLSVEWLVRKLLRLA